MLRTARLTEAMRAHRKTLAASAAVAGVLAGAGGASAALTSSPSSTTLASHAAPSSHHSAFTAASLTSAKKKTKSQAAGRSQFVPIGHSTPTVKSAPPAPSAPATPTQATAAPAQQAAPAPAPAQQAAAPAPAPAPAQPSTIYDSVSASSIPSGARAAVYSDGAYAASPGQVAGHPNTLWIDTNGSNTKANVLDVEPGDATPQQAATWVQQKLSANPNDTAIVYTFRAEWGPTQQAISALPPQMQAHVKWWIADPTGVPHIVPGSDATQWYWGQNYDQSLANPGF